MVHMNGSNTRLRCRCQSLLMEKAGGAPQLPPPPLQLPPLPLLPPPLALLRLLLAPWPTAPPLLLAPSLPAALESLPALLLLPLLLPLLLLLPLAPVLRPHPLSLPPLLLPARLPPLLPGRCCCWHCVPSQLAPPQPRSMWLWRHRKQTRMAGHLRGEGQQGHRQQKACREDFGWAPRMADGCTHCT